jgi:hypothetical protein
MVLVTGLLLNVTVRDGFIRPSTLGSNGVFSLALEPSPETVLRGCSIFAGEPWSSDGLLGLFVSLTAVVHVVQLMS